MTTANLRSTAQALVADGKGILAADETVPTADEALRCAHDRIDAGQPSRLPRDVLHHARASPSSSAASSCRMRRSASGARKELRWPICSRSRGSSPASRSTTARSRLPASRGEQHHRRTRWARATASTEYREMGARFAKWRAVIAIGDGLPSATCMHANAHALARYAALCQEQGIVPIVEPEVLMDGSHTIERCEEVTGHVLHAVFDALFDQQVSLEGMLLKPNMVISGKTVRQAGLRPGGGARDGALSAPARAGRRPRHRVPVGRPGSPPRRRCT